MQRLEYRNKPTTIPSDVMDDCMQIVEAFSSMGYEVSLLDSYRAWYEYSSGGWLPLPDNNGTIVRSAIVYLREA